MLEINSYILRKLGRSNIFLDFDLHAGEILHAAGQQR